MIFDADLRWSVVTKVYGTAKDREFKDMLFGKVQLTDRRQEVSDIRTICEATIADAETFYNIYKELKGNELTMKQRQLLSTGWMSNLHLK